MPILKPQRNGPLYCNTVIGTLAVAGWAEAPPSPLIAVPNVTDHAPINGQCTNFLLFDVAL